MTEKGFFQKIYVTTAMLTVGAALACASAGPVRAQTAGATKIEAAQTSQNAMVTFDIPAGALASALMKLGERTGLQVLYPTEVARNLRSGGATGSMTVDEALTRLLAGTGLTYRFSAADTVTVAVPGQSDNGARITLGTVSVEGRAAPAQADIGNLPPAYAGGQIARGGKVGMLGNRDFMDTPFSQTAYTAQVIEDQQARTIRDVVANDPAVRATWPASGYTDPLFIRGFEASNQDVAFGGLYGIAPTFSIGLGLAERVEILKGPSAMLNGFPPLGSVGGTAIDDQYRTYATSFAGLDYQGDRWRLSADLGYQLQNINAPHLVTNIATGVAVPSVPEASSNWFFPWGWADTEDFFGAGRAEFDLTPDVTFHVAAGAKRTNWGRLTYFPSVKNADGDLSATPSHLEYVYDTDTQEAGARAKIATGAIGHEMSLTATRLHRVQKSGNENIGGAITSNLYAPSSASHPGISDLETPKTADSEFVSLAFGDVLSVYSDRVQVVLGARLQSINARNFSASTGEITSEYDESALSPSVGLIYKPTTKVSFYGNYIEGLQQGAVVGDTYANAGTFLAPYISKQYEVGVKVDLGRLAGSLSLYQITKPSAAADNSNNLTSDGEQRNRGIELSVFGEPLEGLRLMGGLSLIEATLTATADGVNNGNSAPGVPNAQFNMGVEWDAPFAPGLSLSGRAIFTGEQHIDNANTQSLPAWARFDIGLRYRVDRKDLHPFTVRLNVDNLLDSNYWASNYYPGYISAGAPRTVRLSLSSDF
tara:strand:- start:150 stop:2444 length:2295 start_codon:yes stop_codon:yes gene_type:complete